ncbi:hypothetical protein D3C76_1709410 [compost metagenome]
MNHNQKVSGSRLVKKSGTYDQNDHHRIGEMSCIDQNNGLFAGYLLIPNQTGRCVRPSRKSSTHADGKG